MPEKTNINQNEEGIFIPLAQFESESRHDLQAEALKKLGELGVNYWYDEVDMGIESQSDHPEIDFSEVVIDVEKPKAHVRLKLDSFSSSEQGELGLCKESDLKAFIEQVSPNPSGSYSKTMNPLLRVGIGYDFLVRGKFSDPVLRRSEDGIDMDKLYEVVGALGNRKRDDMAPQFGVGSYNSLVLFMNNAIQVSIDKGVVSPPEAK